MKSNRWTALLLTVIMLTSLLIGAAMVSTSRADTTLVQQICYAIADHDDIDEEDTLSIVDFHTRTETVVGPTGTFNVEAIAFHPPTGTLYATDRDQLGTIDLATAQFTPIGQPLGIARGSEGDINIRDVDGLTFDAQTGILWGSNRRGQDGDFDIFIQIDHVNGTIIQDAFGIGVDYVVARPLLINGDFQDIDDLAIDPLTQIMYATANDSGERDHLVTVDRVTGVITDLGLLGVNDMEGLAFDTTGELIGTTGKAGRTTRNSLWEIDKDTALANVASHFPLSQTDYEGVDCLTSWDIVTRTPTPTSTSKVTLTSTPTSTNTPTSSPTPTNTSSPTPTTTSSPTPTATQPGGGATVTPPSATPTATQTRPPVAVELLYFRVDRVEGSNVTLAWETAAEIDNLGFWVYRAPSNDFSQAVRLNQFVPARGGVSGATYSLADNPGNGIWWYWLVDVDTQNVETRHGPVNTSVPASGMSAGGVLYFPLTTVGK